jgi:hypothetical protein
VAASWGQFCSLDESSDTPAYCVRGRSAPPVHPGAALRPEADLVRRRPARRLAVTAAPRCSRRSLGGRWRTLRLKLALADLATLLGEQAADALDPPAQVAVGEVLPVPEGGQWWPLHRSGRAAVSGEMRLRVRNCSHHCPNLRAPAASRRPSRQDERLFGLSRSPTVPMQGDVAAIKAESAPRKRDEGQTSLLSVVTPMPHGQQATQCRAADP